MPLLAEHKARRPGMQVRDVYKLLYQGVLGPEHSLPSPTVFLERLQQEWDALEPGDADPFQESICPDGSLLRLNMRPFKAAGGRLEDLAAACLETSRRPWGRQDALVETWQQFLAACRAGEPLPLPAGDVDTFTAWIEDQEYPPVHHSQPYRDLYRPAYRLVAAGTMHEPN